MNASLFRCPIPLLSAMAVMGGMPVGGAQDGKEKGAPEKAEENHPRLRELDFAPFEGALAGLGGERAGKIGALVMAGTVPELQKALAAGEVTSEELTLFFLSRIQRYDGRLRSYTELNPRCLEEARSADRLRAEGRLLGPLHGIPLNVKDNIGTAAPMHTTAGAEILLNHSPAKDAALVRQLREGGAVILGKAALSELAGVLTTQPAGYNAVSGIGVNPYGKGFPVSGSSSGSGISTAAFLTMMSVGSETSGSLISPGSKTGVVAMKPSLGVVSGEGVVPLVRFQDSAGPVTRSVTDAAVLLDVMDSKVEDYAAGLDAKALEGVSAGVLRVDIAGKSEPKRNPDWLALIDEGLKKAGAVSRDVTLQDDVELMPIIALGMSQETVGYMAAAGAPVKTLAELQAYNAASPGRRIPRGQNMIDLSTKILWATLVGRGLKENEAGKAYEELALQARASAAGSLAKTFAENEVEILVSLSNRHSQSYATGGYPAITVPLGLNKDGAPNGVTFIGKPGQDAKLLACAYAFEQATRYRRNPPDTEK